MKPRATIIWIDLETTGLNPKDHQVLEVAAIATTDDLTELGRFHAITNKAAQVTANQVSPEAIGMHVLSGLWNESILARGKEFELQAVDKALADFISLHVNGDLTEPEIRRLNVNPEERKARAPQLAGMTVSFDRGFMEWHLPQAAGLLHYRNVDVTTLHEVSRRWWPEAHNRGTAAVAHRAMADIEATLACARKYRDTIGTWCEAEDALSFLRKKIDKGELVDKPPEGVPVIVDQEVVEAEIERRVAARLATMIEAPEAEYLAGLRELVNLPAVQLSKALRTAEVGDAFAWIREVLVELDQRKAEADTDNANEVAQ